MSIIDNFAKGLIADSNLATAMTKPLADIKRVTDLAAQTTAALQVAVASIEQLLAAYGVKVEPPK